MTREKDREERGFSRRDFMKMGGMGMLAIGLASCSDDDDDDDDNNQNVSEPSPNAVTPSPQYFPQSVASGDPRPDSVIFWTRVEDSSASGDLQVRLIVGLDPELTNVIYSQTHTAGAEFDGSLKVKVMLLSPYTTYYYQFQYVRGSESLGSKVGKTKTSPTADMDVTARFSFISCQDYRDRFYNSLADMARRDDLDFVVHLGDYIYETTSGQGGVIEDPDAGIIRGIVFSDPDGAIPLGPESLAARSVSNYRDIYKTYRSDEALQAVHERFPMIAIWDDHELSNDYWKTSGTYFNDAVDEADLERRLNAERVYAEFMPLDFGLDNNGQLVSGDEGYYPNTRIYRDFQYGKHLHLILTDTRSFRPDHLIPEGAWPGTVVFDQTVLEQALGAQGIPFAAIASNFAAYVNIDAAELGPYKQVLTGVLTQQLVQGGIPAEVAAPKAAEAISGNVSIFVANAMLQAYNATNPPQPVPLLNESGAPRGLAYYLLGKQSMFSSFGARDQVVRDTFELYAGILYQLTGGASEDVLGTEQEGWLSTSLEQSAATWRVLGSSIPMAPFALGLDDMPVPATFKRTFMLGADQWQGYPNKRDAVLAKLAQHPNTVVISGDVHSSLVTDHGESVYEFTITSVSSETIKGFVEEVIAGPPFSDIPGVSALVEQMASLMLQGSPSLPDGNRKIRYVRPDVHGYAVMEVDGHSLRTFYSHIDESHVSEKLYDSQSLSTYFNRFGFEVRNGKLTQIF